MSNKQAVLIVALLVLAWLTFPTVIAYACLLAAGIACSWGEEKDAERP